MALKQVALNFANLPFFVNKYLKIQRQQRRETCEILGEIHDLEPVGLF